MTLTLVLKTIILSDKPHGQKLLHDVSLYKYIYSSKFLASVRFAVPLHSRGKTLPHGAKVPATYACVIGCGKLAAVVVRAPLA